MQLVKDKNLLTVLLISYNHKAYFEKSIESVLEQNTDFDFQIHIVDDASTDGTSDIVRDYASRYPNKIKAFIREENIGVIENIYQGISGITTKYFATLETDDWWCDENKLQLQVDALESNPDCSFCAHDCRVNNPTQSDAAPVDGRTIGSYHQKNARQKIGMGDVFWVHISTRMFRKDCLDLSNLKNKASIVFDYCSYYYCLSKGSLYYIDKVMSEHNCTGDGWFSGSAFEARQRVSLKAVITINEELEFKYDKLFTKEIRRFASKKMTRQFWWVKLLLGPQKAYRLWRQKLE